MKRIILKHGLFNILYFINIVAFYACLFTAIFLRYIDKTNNVNRLKIVMIIISIILLIIKIIDLIFKKLLTNKTK